MQYEGVAVMKMFDKVKVNVNLLIYLLNKKFYGKWSASRNFMDSASSGSGNESV